jgi:hypothetical protein
MKNDKRRERKTKGSESGRPGERERGRVPPPLAGMKKDK